MFISSINLLSYSTEHLLEAGTHGPHAAAVGKACLLITGSLQYLHQHLLLQIIIMSYNMDQIAQPKASFLLTGFQSFFFSHSILVTSLIPEPWTYAGPRSDKTCKLKWRKTLSGSSSEDTHISFEPVSVISKDILGLMFQRYCRLVCSSMGWCYRIILIYKVSRSFCRSQEEKTGRMSF